MKKIKVGLIILFSVVLLGGIGIYNTFFTIQNIKGQEFMTEVVLPDGTYTISMYLNNGGATTSYAVLGTLHNNNTHKEKNIYWEYDCEKAEVKWENDKTVVINNKKLDVTKDTYDFRNK